MWKQQTIMFMDIERNQLMLVYDIYNINNNKIWL